MAAKWSPPMWLILVFAWMVVVIEADSFETFKRKNVDYPEPTVHDVAVYCNDIMKRRHIRLHLNFFIHASDAQLEAICTFMGRPLTGQFRSNNRLPYTSCRETRNGFYGLQGTGYPVVYCQNGKPIEFRIIDHR
ncbi:ribonuclease-like [Rhineura floridana]|uniref:ribonuclease-like n=1 Tax=Rhineura floridana TaxID=261503 RepID=UPI002AC88A68|nr:ribonuclease-like [Rhineura floridana]